MDPGIEMTVDELKDYNKNSVFLLLNAYNNNVFAFGGNVYQSDEVSRSNISGTSTMALLLLQRGSDFPANFTWRSADNQDIPMTAVDVLNMGATLFSFISTNYLNSFHHKTLIDNLTTVQELIDYDITTGWQGTLPW